MEAMREAWTDRRLDGLDHRVDQFELRVDERFDRVDEKFDRVDEKFDRVDERFDQLEGRYPGAAPCSSLPEWGCMPPQTGQLGSGTTGSRSTSIVRRSKM